jgi:TolB-like protein/Flp pilus assembly protein TadD
MLEVQLLGAIAVRRDGKELDLPKSKKTRGLLALLASSDRPLRRERLCSMLWEVPDDPRGALRWSLSKLRGVLDEPGVVRLVADRDTIRFDPVDAEVDALALRRALGAGPAGIETARLHELVGRFRGDFLEGLEIGACPEFEAWRLAEREACRGLRAGAVRDLAGRFADRPEEAVPLLRALLAEDPLDESGHAALVRTLARLGRLREAEEHGALAERLLRGVSDRVELDRALREARERRPVAPPAPAVPEPRAEAAAPEAPPASADPRPAIAVLPFENLADDPDQRYFSDGITQDIVTELSRFRQLLVVASRSSFSFRDEADQVARAVRDLGVAYVLEGSVRRAGDRVRVVANLVDGTTRTSLWSERYDRELADIFAIQDEIARRIVATLAGRIAALGAERARRKRPGSIAAYDCVLRGQEALDRYTLEDHALARAMFEEALALDSGYARALAGLASTWLYDWFLAADPEALDRAYDLAQKALDLDPEDAWCAMIVGRVMLHRRRFDLAQHFYDQAIALNQNDADILASRSYLLTCLGRAEEAVAAVKGAMALNPHHRSWYWENLGNALFALKRYDEALAALRKVQDRPPYVMGYLAACLARLGRLDEARAQAAAAIAEDPSQCVERHRRGEPYANPADLEDFLDALRLAGFPERAEAPVAG